MYGNVVVRSMQAPVRYVWLILWGAWNVIIDMYGMSVTGTGEFSGLFFVNQTIFAYLV